MLICFIYGVRKCRESHFHIRPPGFRSDPPTPRGGGGLVLALAASFSPLLCSFGAGCWCWLSIQPPALCCFLLAMCRQTGRCCSPGSLLHIVASNATLLTLRLLVQMPQTPNRFQRGYICVNEKGKQGIAGPFYKLASNARMANNCHFAACWAASQTL